MSYSRSSLPVKLSVDIKDFILSYLRDDIATVMRNSIQYYFVDGAWCRERRRNDYCSRGDKIRLLSFRRSAKDCTNAYIRACGASHSYVMDMRNQDEEDHCIIPSQLPVYYIRSCYLLKNKMARRKNPVRKSKK